ncbi:MAG: hypothetical protein HOW97_14005 [Catenulispora sp.]|nr:hypothetical protein [Catenulispora sp.]
MRFPRFRSKRATYLRLLTEVVEHEVVREAEEIVGAAWMAGLLEAAGRTAGRLRPGDQPISEFVTREREVWATAAKVRALDAIADRERLSEAALAAGIRDASVADLLG